VSVTNFKSRASEYAADRFVKEMGRATNLQNALSLLEYNIDYHKLSDHFFLNIIIDIFDILFYPIVQYTHPPTHKRLEALKEDIDITFSLPDLINILNPLDKLIFQNNGLLCKF
jgi:Zn-dependent protease with chaperone function